MRPSQIGWYALQAAIVLGVFVFYVEIINKETPNQVAPHVAVIIGVLLALLVTVTLSGLIRLFRWLLGRSSRQGGVR